MKIQLITFRCSACNHRQQVMASDKLLRCGKCDYIAKWNGKEWVSKPFKEQSEKYHIWYEKHESRKT